MQGGKGKTQLAIANKQTKSIELVVHTQIYAYAYMYIHICMYLMGWKLIRHF